MDSDQYSDSDLDEENDEDIDDNSFSTKYDEAMPLHLAVSNNSITRTRSILNSGYNVNTQDSEGRTPLMLAVSNRKRMYTQIVKLLLDAGADIYMTDNFNRSALKILLDDQMKYIIESITSVLNLILNNQNYIKHDIIDMFLCRVKLSCNNAIDLMANVLHDANCSFEDVVRMRNAELTKFMLLKYGYYVDVRNPRNRRTALHVTVEQMDLENIKMLVEHGADVNAKDLWNQVPLALFSDAAASTNQNLDILKFLMDKGTRLAQSSNFIFRADNRDSESIFSLFEHGTKEVLRLLFEYEIDLSARDWRGCTPVHAVAENYNPGAASVLKSTNFNVNVVNKFDETPLMSALAAGNASTVRFLIENGADVNHEGPAGITPLQSMFFNEESQRKPRRKGMYEACAELLLQHGADPQVIFQNIMMQEDPTLFGIIERRETPDITRTIIMHLAKLEALDKSLIKDTIRYQINACPRKKRRFELYRREFESMKKTKIYRSLDMFTLFNDVTMNFAERYHCHSKIISKLNSASRKKYPDSYLHRQLKKRIRVTIKKLKERVIASAFISNALSLPNNDHIITQKVINYLSYADHKKLVKVYCKYKK